jgi:hypothetical protein
MIGRTNNQVICLFGESSVYFWGFMGGSVFWGCLNNWMVGHGLSSFPGNAESESWWGFRMRFRSLIWSKSPYGSSLWEMIVQSSERMVKVSAEAEGILLSLSFLSYYVWEKSNTYRILQWMLEPQWMQCWHWANLCHHCTIKSINTEKHFKFFIISIT